MGDMADMALSDTMDMEDLRFEYFMGGMSDLDAYDYGIIDEMGGERYKPMFASPKPSSKTCKYCGTTGLHWSSTSTGWRLTDSHGIHECNAHPSRSPLQQN